MTLSIFEYSDVGSTQRGVVNIPLEPPVAIQTIDVGATSVVSDFVSNSTVIIKLQSDEDAVFDVGPEPDASSSARKLVAGVETTIAIPPGKGMRIAVKASGSTSVSGMESLEGLLGLITSPTEVKKQLDALSKATAKHDASAKASKDALEALGHADNLAQWEADLKERETDVAARAAELETKFAKLRALT
jgi:hypothetical protein